MKKSTALRKMLEKMQQVPDSDLYSGHRQINASVIRLVSALEGLEGIALHRDPTETEAKHAQRVAEAARKLEARIEEIRTQLDAGLRDSASRLDDVISEQAGLAENEFAREIREAVRNMPEKKRLETLSQAVRDGEAATVAALVNAPPVTTGLAPEHTSKLVDHYRHVHAPEASAAFDELWDAYDHALTVVSNVKEAATSAYDPSFINAVQAQQAAAEKAAQSFNESLTQGV